MKTKIRIFIMAFLLPVLFLSQSCEKIKDKINEETKFDHSFDLPGQSFTLDSINFKSTPALLTWTDMYTYDVAIDLQSVLDDNGLSDASFSDGSFTSFYIQLVSPPGITFSFVDQMRIGISLASDFNPISIVATTGTISPDATTVDFTVEPVDITPYLEAPVFYVKLEGFKLTNLPTVSVQLNLNGEGVITVNPL